MCHRRERGKEAGRDRAEREREREKGPHEHGPPRGKSESNPLKEKEKIQERRIIRGNERTRM